MRTIRALLLVSLSLSISAQEQEIEHPRRTNYQGNITYSIGNTIKDTVQEVIADSTYLGTDEELEEEIRNGTVQRYFVTKGGLLYERIIPVTDNENFFETYWPMLAGIGLVLLLLFYKKYYVPTIPDDEGYHTDNK